MAVPVGKRSENRLLVLDRAQKLAIELIESTANSKNFPGKYSPIVERVNGTAWDICENIWEAKRVVVGEGAAPAAIKKRKKHQARAIAQCNKLSFQLDMLASALHLDTAWLVKKGEKVEEVRSLAVAWMKSDGSPARA